jgi:5-methylcytosine-specific restriction enzyme A
MVFVEIDVLVPLCPACRHSECRWLETAFPQLPHVFSENWRRNYLEMGIPKKKVREASRALRNGTWRGPGCYQCGSVIGLNMRGSEGFYLKTLSISSFYSLNRGYGRKPPKWMKAIVFQAYEGKCSDCGITTTSTATFDHIVPVTDGGETHIENLQLMCQRCNNEEKRNLTVEHVRHPSLCLPLLPPSDNFLN